MPFPVDEKYILETEQKLGLQFPSAFREKMKRDNGGEVDTPEDQWQLHPFLDASDKKRLKRTCNSVLSETENARQWHLFPPEAVAIGTNGGGDRLILLPGKNSAILDDAVFWWDHETGELNKIADSFGDLIQ